MRFLVALLGISTYLGPHATASPALPEAGGLGAGINLDFAEMGPVQAFGAGGGSFGLRFGLALQIDTGPRWAVRVPLVLASAPWGSGGFADISTVPGLLYRFRRDPDQRWVPFLGGGVKLGAWGAHRELLDQPLVTAFHGFLRDDDDFDFDGDDSDPNFEVNLGAGLELWAGAEWHPNRWFAMTFQVAAFAVRVHAASVFGVAQMVGLRLSI